MFRRRTLRAQYDFYLNALISKIARRTGRPRSMRISRAISLGAHVSEELNFVEVQGPSSVLPRTFQALALMP